jgi:hypothetical protein
MAERYMELLPFVHMSAWLGLLMVRGAGGRLDRQPPVKCGGCQPIADWRARRSDSVDEAHELHFDDDSRLRCTLAKLQGKPAALDWLGGFTV